MDANGIWYSAVLVILIPAVIGDIRTDRVSNRWILAGLGAGWGLQVFFGFPSGFTDVLLGCLLPMFLFWILFHIHALGAGDVKLFCVLGCFLGCRLLVIAACLAFFSGACRGLVLLMRHRALLPALSDLFNYFQTVYCMKRPVTYFGSTGSGRIHFTIDILIGFLILMTAKYGMACL